jgi:hypothetical protein
VYPYWKRVRQYFVSALVTISMLSVAFLVMVCSLNLQGAMLAVVVISFANAPSFLARRIH